MSEVWHKKTDSNIYPTLPLFYRGWKEYENLHRFSIPLA